MVDDNNNKKGFSLLEEALIGAPVSVGLHSAFKSMSEKGYFNVPKQMGASEFLSTLQRSGIQPATGSIDLSYLAEKSSQFRTKEGAEMARSAWIQAVRSTDPLASEVLSFAGNIETTPFNKVFSTIEQTLQRNNSLFMARSYSKFKKNVSALEKHMAAGKGLPKFTAVSNIGLPPPRNMAVNELPKELAAFQKSFLKGTGVSSTGVSYYTRKGWAQEGFGTYIMGFQHGNTPFEIQVPMTSRGMLVEGLSQSSRRIAPSVDIFDPRSGKVIETLNRTEFYLRDIQQSILPRIRSGELKSSYQIQQAISQAYEANIFSLENIPNLPPGMRDKAWESYTRMKSQAVDIRTVGKLGELKPGELYRSIFGVPDDRTFTQALGAGDYFPFTSPGNLAKKRVSRFDPSGWTMTPEVAEIPKLRQVNREWRATPEAAKAMMKTPWATFETQAWRRDFGHYAAPHIRTIYVDPTKHGAVLEQLGMKEGEALLANTPALRKQLEVSRVANPLHLAQFADDLEERIAQNAKFEVGELLGYSPEGDPIKYKRGMSLLGLEKFETKGKGAFASLYYKETRGPDLVGKYFGGFKGLQRMEDQFAMEKAIAQMTTNFEFTRNEGAVRLVTMDELRKDRSKFNTQLITGLYDTINKNRSREAIKRSGKLASFMRNPRVFAEYSFKQGGQEKFVETLSRLAIQEGKLTPSEYGAVFGAVPYVMGEEFANRLIPNQRYFSQLEGLSGGISQAIYAGSAEMTGAGAMGSLEPRAFDLLKGGQYGALGNEIADDLARRMAVSEPHKLAAYEALTKTLQSAGGKMKTGGAAAWDVAARGYSREGFQEFIEKGGGFVKLGSGRGNIFVPGADVLAPFYSAGGEVMAGDLANEYHTLTREFAKVYHGNKRASLEEATQALDRFISNIGEQQAPFGKGAGAFARGRLLGSQFLRGVSKVGGKRTTNIFTVGVPEQYGAQMFEDLASTGLYNPEQIAKMRRRFLSGETVGGVLSRHPFIGPYSLQPIEMKMLQGVKEPVLTLPSHMINVGLGGGSANPIELSPLVGLAGDLDADIYSVSLVSPDVEKNIRKNFTRADNEYTKAYMEHSVRSQIIKAKTAKSTLPEGAITLKQMADIKKLGTSQEWIPKVSTQLSVARQAVSSRLKGQQAANAMFTLQWLEQVPISGKHLDPNRVLSEEMSTLFQSVQSSLETRNAERLESTIQGILRESDDVSRQLLERDIQITQGIEEIRRVSGVKSMRDVLPAINLRETTRDIMSAMETYEQSGMMEMSKLTSGRQRLTPGVLGKYLSYSGSVLGPPKQMMANVSKAMLTAKNFAASVGAGLLEHKKPIGFGFAGALAIGTILSKPDDLVGTGSELIPEAKTSAEFNKAAARMKIEDVLPPEQSIGEPTVPPMIHTPTARISSGNRNFSISARGGRIDNMNRFNKRVYQNTNSDRISINVRDNTRSLNINSIADKILK